MTWKDYYRKIIRAKGYTIRFGYLWNFKCGKRKASFGQYEYDKKTITINLHKNNPPARNFIHELLHHLKDEPSHEEVQRIEGEIWKNLTQKQKVKLYKKLFQ